LSKVSKSTTPQNLIENTINETSSTPETKKNSMFALENAKSEVMKAIGSSTLENDNDKSKENFAQQYYVVNKNVSMSPVPRNDEHLSRLSSPTSAHQTYFQASSRASEDLVLDRSNLKITEIQAVTAKIIDDNHGGKLVSNTIYRENSTVDKNSNKNKSDLDRELDSLDKLHQVKIDRINDNFKDKPEKRIDLSNKEVHANRPSVLGPSRFDSGSYKYIPQTSPATKDPAPRRNQESVMNVKDSTKSDIKPVSSTTVTPLTKSYTTADIGLMSPNTSRKRFDSNFNAVPEPFKFSSKAADTTKDEISYSQPSKTTTIESNTSKIQDSVSQTHLPHQ